MTNDSSGASLLNVLPTEASTTVDSWKDLGALINNALRTFGYVVLKHKMTQLVICMWTMRFMT
jgi:hypothetical protein